MTMLTAWRRLPRWLGFPFEGAIRADWRIVERAQSAARALRSHSTGELLAQATQMRCSEATRQSLQAEFLASALALFVESLRRESGLEAYDVQLLAGLMMARGKIAEMATGEGKTLAAACAAGVLALGGRKVHVVTPNAYLARRDHQSAAPILKQLGLGCALLPEQGDLAAKRAAYQSPIVYGTGYEFGFDFLRDQLLLRQSAELPLGSRCLARLAGSQPVHSALLQTDHDCALIDEIDAVLIDEASLPLVLSGSQAATSHERAFHLARQTALGLEPGLDFVVSVSERRVAFTAQGNQRLLAPSTDAGRLPLARPWTAYVEQALQAEWILRRDADYVVRGGKVLTVDQQTGRIFPDRTWQNGLHQAVEAKEDLPISPEQATSARISRQRYFRRYKTLCGLTGTVGNAHSEFRQVHGLRAATIPLRLPCRRTMLPGRFFRDEATKLQAIVAEIAAVAGMGRAVLAGTRTIECSRQLSGLLAKAGIPHRLLNGTQDEDEAQIVRRAGEPGVITIATNMAGRGTDIRLAPEVARLGGLLVIGVERHESSRVDRQLAGRAARQGDPGSCRFYVSADDALLVRFGDALRRKMQRLPNENGEIVKDLSAQLAAVQRVAEISAHQNRQQLAAHDDWLGQLLESRGP